jgi:ArsR family transcriptional regulator
MTMINDSIGQATPAASTEFNTSTFEKAARLFEAVGDVARLRLLLLLLQGEKSVGEIAAFTGEGLSTVSQRLRILKNENLITSRRDGKHIYYMMADQHIADLVMSALQHASEHPDY